MFLVSVSVVVMWTEKLDYNTIRQKMNTLKCNQKYKC